MFFHSHTVFLYRSPFFVSRFLSLSIFIYICVFECALLTVILVCTVHSLVQHFLCAYLIVWRVTKRTLDKHTNMWTKDRIHSTLSLFLLVLWELFVHLVYYNELHFLLKWISSGFFFVFVLSSFSLLVLTFIRWLEYLLAFYCVSKVMLEPTVLQWHSDQWQNLDLMMFKWYKYMP